MADAVTNEGHGLERRPVPGFEALYEITRRGDVYSRRLNKFIRQQERVEGRFFIEFQVDHETHRMPLAETIADAFLTAADKRAILAAIPHHKRMSPEAITRHAQVWVLSQRYNLAPGAILSVFLRTRRKAA